MTFDELIATMNRLRGEEISVGVYPVPDTDYAVWLDGKVESVVQRPYPVDDRRYDVHLGPGHLQLAESSFRDVILEDDPGEEKWEWFFVVRLHGGGSIMILSDKIGPDGVPDAAEGG